MQNHINNFKMEVLVVFSYFLCSLYAISAQDDWLVSLFRQHEPCFHTVKSTECNTPLWESFTSKYPVHADVEPQTFVYLFTPTNPEVAEPLHECGGRLGDDTTYDVDANTEIFIHGFVEGVCRVAWMRECKEQLFERAKMTNSAYNVILVDWSWGNGFPYDSAVPNVRVVGEQVAFVINNIMQQKGIFPEKFHIIGHSLGAITAGFVGRNVNGLLRRITALEPSLPGFLHVPPNERVTYRDAQIVDVIHTNGLLCPPLYFGDPRQLGHADFYPNGGSVQISCLSYIIESFLKGDYIYALETLLPTVCSHNHATQYYKLSINPQGCQFVGISDRSYNEFLNKSSTSTSEWSIMGMDYELYHKNDGRKRKFFLTTTDTCPYYDYSYLDNSLLPFKASCEDNDDFTLF